MKESMFDKIILQSNQYVYKFKEEDEVAYELEQESFDPEKLAAGNPKTYMDLVNYKFNTRDQNSLVEFVSYYKEQKKRKIDHLLRMTKKKNKVKSADSGDPDWI